MENKSGAVPRDAIKKELLTLLSVLLMISIAYLTYLKGHSINFYVFYYVPVFIMAWYMGMTAAVIISFVAALNWLLFGWLSGHSSPLSAIAYWNACVRCASFILFAVAVVLFKKERLLKDEL
jgi:hypothetical protein